MKVLERTDYEEDSSFDVVKIQDDKSETHNLLVEDSIAKNLAHDSIVYIKNVDYVNKKSAFLLTDETYIMNFISPAKVANDL